MRALNRLALAAGLLVSATAHAQQAAPEEIPFEGGRFTITETADQDKILAFDGKEIARNYVVYHDRTVTIGGRQVALFSVGDGGNACGTATVIAWKPESGDIRSDIVGEDCGSPPAAVTGDSIYFVPYLVPGESALAEVWSPDEGVRVAGTLTFTPQPGTQWSDLDPSGLDNIIDALRNEAIYRDAQKLLGSSLTEVMTGLLVGGGPQMLPSGVIHASGCVPHACGSADAFMAIDARGQKLYFAQESDQPEPRTWPALDGWPADLKQAMHTAFNPPQ
ncbi:hypothetical protein MesoLjLc_16650 [Mesorhizobium sp. L-8-10]|uniref:hypothetical protein n=1 Tax=Mesorhizobium sp. L-8-10 TaxID=2744523 RepID=UPI0019259CDD|nr:hypothetical protein [Mesorhizobium sp. L-8-10]BCH29735.1 hypothetical protein MesoLjLc_16650 [Mesorhizobium sp. L-8-10]